MGIREEIKSYIVRSGMTMTEVVDRLYDDYDWSRSVPNLSGKLRRGSLRYQEAVELADVLDYDIVWVKRKRQGGTMAQKAQHAILRFAKHKAGPAGALEAHHERTKEKYASNPDIDISKSKDNFHIIQPTQKYRKEIDTRIKAAGCRTRKDSTMFVDTLITASPEFFTGRSKKEVQAYFTEAVAFMEKKVGRGNIFSAVVHMDEKTPHLHLCFTPITEDGRLSAKEILGNRAQLSQWQDEFHVYMKKAFPVLKRGESALVTKRKHIPTWLFKQSVDLTRQQQAIEKAVSEIGVLNAGKKRDEILEIVGPYFSRLEKYLGQMKKYQATIDYLTQENEGLKEKVNSEKSIQKKMEVLTLKKENERLRRFVESIPPEVRRILREQQRQQRPKDHDL